MAHRYRLRVGETTFRVSNYLLLALISLVTLYPFWFVIQASFTDPTVRIRLLWPRAYYYVNYWLVFVHSGVWGASIWNAYLITILRVGVTVPLMLVVTGAAAFALTRKELKARRTIITYYFITMFVSGGLIPYYMLIRALGLLNTFFVFVFPMLYSVWTMIVMKTSFQGLPEGLVGAALIDGASYGRIFFKIILPLSIPMITTLGLFQAVWHWNDWFVGSFFIKAPKLWPLQTFLRYAVVTVGGPENIAYSLGGAANNPEELAQDPRIIAQLIKVTSESVKYAFIVVTTMPILLVYPFIQRYFIKGVLIGSIKE